MRKTSTTDRTAARAARVAYASALAARVILIGALALAAARPSRVVAADTGSGMTVQEAYEETGGHRHADFDPTAPGFSHAETVYLSKLFDLVDQAIVEKTQTWVWFQSEGRRGASFRDTRGRVDRLIAELAAMQAPSRLAQVQKLMVEAVRDQRGFFDAWQQAFDAAERGEDNRQAHATRGRLMQSSSQKLHAAYNELTTLFPAAGRRNLDAFYDHLCVLDLL